MSIVNGVGVGRRNSDSLVWDGAMVGGSGLGVGVSANAGELAKNIKRRKAGIHDLDIYIPIAANPMMA